MLLVVGQRTWVNMGIMVMKLVMLLLVWCHPHTSIKQSYEGGMPGQSSLQWIARNVHGFGMPCNHGMVTTMGEIMWEVLQGLHAIILVWSCMCCCFCGLPETVVCIHMQCTYACCFPAFSHTHILPIQPQAPGTAAGGSASAPLSLAQLRQTVGRHRFKHVPPPTPPGFWDIGFGDSQEREQQQQREQQALKEQQQQGMGSQQSGSPPPASVRA